MSQCKLTYFVHLFYFYLFFADHAKDSTFGLQSDICSKLRVPGKKRTPDRPADPGPHR